jgi:hypothetical protein
MQPIGKNDTVILSDSFSGKVMDIIATDAITVFKIQRFPDNEVIYVEANMVLLKKQCTLNYVSTFFYGVVGFLFYVMELLMKGRL